MTKAGILSVKTQKRSAADLLRCASSAMRSGLDHGLEVYMPKKRLEPGGPLALFPIELDKRPLCKFMLDEAGNGVVGKNFLWSAAGVRGFHDIDKCHKKDNNVIVAFANDPLFVWHISIALLAYSLFTFAALHALLMAAAERSLHQKTPFLKLTEFPPIMAMESLLFRIIGLGFFLLTLTLISGMLFSEQIFHQALKFNHKNIFTIISWVIFGSLLIGRVQYGWRGRTAIRWTLTGFGVLLLAYVGSKFVLEVLLNR